MDSSTFMWLSGTSRKQCLFPALIQKMGPGNEANACEAAEVPEGKPWKTSGTHTSLPKIYTSPIFLLDQMCVL